MDISSRSLSMREPRRRGNLVRRNRPHPVNLLAARLTREWCLGSWRVGGVQAPIPEVDDKKNAARLAEMNKRSKTPDPKTMRNAKAAKSQARFYKDGSEYIGDLSKVGRAAYAIIIVFTWRAVFSPHTYSAVIRPDYPAADK